jgi:hypothetical protein
MCGVSKSYTHVLALYGDWSCATIKPTAGKLSRRLMYYARTDVERTAERLKSKRKEMEIVLAFTVGCIVGLVAGTAWAQFS